MAEETAEQLHEEWNRLAPVPDAAGFEVLFPRAQLAKKLVLQHLDRVPEELHHSIYRTAFRLEINPFARRKKGKSVYERLLASRFKSTKRPPRRSWIFRRLDYAELIESVESLGEAMNSHPRYESAEFKCLSDYDKCTERRGKTGTCALALFICLARRIIPLVHKVT